MPKDETFETYATAVMGKNSGRLAAFFIAAALLWWPLDGLLFDHHPALRNAYGVMRMGVIATNALVLLWLWRFGPPRRCSGVTTLLVMCAQIFFATAVLNGATGVRSQEPMYFYLAPFLSILIIWPLPKRCLAAAALVVAVAAGLRVSNPLQFTELVLVEYVAYFIFCAAFATGIGHLLYRVIHSDFRARSRLAARDRELRELAGSLEQQVRVQTSQLRKLNASIEDTLEAERRRISRELHDELGQQLAAMRFAIDFGRRSQDPQSSRTVMSELDGLLDRTHQTIRGILRGLNPLALEQLGFIEALTWLGEETSARSQVNCTVRASSFPPLPAPMQTCLFRCAQEALTNAIRHADASNITIDLTRQSGHYVMLVHDDGRGFPSDTPSGLGITGIRERARRWGGTATWTTGRHGGTTLRIEIPQNPSDPLAETA